MKNYTFKEYFYLAHCENGSPSSKRLYGGIGWMICQFCLIVASILSFIHLGNLSDIVKDMWIFDLITSSALLGLSTIAGAFGGKQIVINKKLEDDGTNRLGSTE